MKNIGTTVISILLSMLVITLSTGISWVHCCHSGAVEWAQLSPSELPCAQDFSTGQSCCKDSQGCCHAQDKAAAGTTVKQHGCMETHTLQLDPSQLQSQPHFDFSQIPVFIIPTYAPSMAEVHDRVAEVSNNEIPAGYKSPPRGYLHLLRILRL